MKWLALIFTLFILVSCGGSGSKNKGPFVDTTSIDTASVEQLEKELKSLEEQSSQVDKKIDSIDNLLNE